MNQDLLAVGLLLFLMTSAMVFVLGGGDDEQ